jgi:hypothetical protein
MIPIAPFVLGIAGLIPFVWGVVTMLVPSLADWTVSTFGPRFVGPYVQLFYGSVILSFMGGSLWGFAAKTQGIKSVVAYGLSVLPPLWAFAMTGGGPVSAATHLMSGFAGLLIIDLAFSLWGLTPSWWMRLRLPLSIIVIGCLSLGVLW